MPSPQLAHAARYRRNLRKLYAQATMADVREGMAWYPAAFAGCQAWANTFNVDARTIACVIATISPQCDWTSNLRIAFEMLSGQSIVTGGALRANVAKARRVLQDGATSLDGYFKQGPKVKAFSHNLQGNPWPIVVDSHAVQALKNEPLFTKSFHPAAYAVFADCYRDVALSVNVRPCDFQAIIWCAWKRRHSTASKRRKLAQLRRAA